MNSKIVFPLNGLQELEKILGFRAKMPLDVVLMSLDLEVKTDTPEKKMWDEITEIGVSILDTRSLSDPRSIRLRTPHFIVSGQRKFHHVSSKFHFGTSDHMAGQVSKPP